MCFPGHYGWPGALSELSTVVSWTPERIQHFCQGFRNMRERVTMKTIEFSGYYSAQLMP